MWRSVAIEFSLALVWYNVNKLGMILLKISKILKELRKENEYSQQDVADFLNISRSTYGKYETGDREPSLEMLCKLADFYKVTTDYLLGREE